MFKFLKQVFPGNADEDRARGLYEAAVLQARNPVFYEKLGVADSVDGRFDMILLHLYLILRRLRREGESAKGLAQTLFDLMIYDMDQSLRTSGVGDLKVGPKLRLMAESFYGRMGAYDEALASEDEGALARALIRNVYAGAREEGDAQVLSLARYLRAEISSLEAQASSDLMAGQVVFGPVPEGAAA